MNSNCNWSQVSDFSPLRKTVDKILGTASCAFLSEKLKTGWYAGRRTNTARSLKQTKARLDRQSISSSSTARKKSMNRRTWPSVFPPSEWGTKGETSYTSCYRFTLKVHLSINLMLYIRIQWILAVYSGKWRKVLLKRKNITL